MIDSACNPPKEGLEFVSDSHSRTGIVNEVGRRQAYRMAILACLFLLGACAQDAKVAQIDPTTKATTHTGDTPERNAEEAAQPSPTSPEEPGSEEQGEAAGEQTEEESEEALEEEARKQRSRTRLKTAYDDRSVGEEQTSIVEAEMGLYKDEDLERYVHSVAVRLLRHAPPQPFDYEFKVVDQVVPNAFALPGGKIFLTRGLLALMGTEDELAAVLGHEITHAAERHAAARIEHASRINPFAIGIVRAATIAAYGREHERDADRGGQIMSAKAGYDPDGIATFLRKLDASERYEVGWSRLPSFLATHPTSPERSATAAQRSAELDWEPAPSVASERGASTDYLDLIDGLVLGPDPAGGLFKDGRFVHPDMRFSLRFPPGWSTQNDPQAVTAISPARDAEASLTAVGSSGDIEKTVDEFLSQEDGGFQFRVLERRPFKIGDLPAIRVVGRARGLHSVMAFVEYEGLVFRLSLLTASGSENKYRGRAHSFIQSFRPLDEEGIYSLEVTRLRIARALERETLEQLSTRTHNDLEIVYTGVLNDLFASTELSKGHRVKIGLSEPYFPAPREEPENQEGAEATNEASKEVDAAP
jgi:predicted Zn-dependent protease